MLSRVVVLLWVAAFSWQASAAEYLAHCECSVNVQSGSGSTAKEAIDHARSQCSSISHSMEVTTGTRYNCHPFIGFLDAITFRTAYDCERTVTKTWNLTPGKCTVNEIKESSEISGKEAELMMASFSLSLGQLKSAHGNSAVGIFIDEKNSGLETPFSTKEEQAKRSPRSSSVF